MTDGPDQPEADAPTGPSLADLLDDLVDEFPDVEQRQGPGGLDYLVGPQPFARLAGAIADFRLTTDIVAAALRTPGAARSGLGTEWVAFEPRTLDQYALDRAQSWFELAHRLAAEARGAAPGGRRH